MLKLYSYWRSSAAFRVRIALNLKGIPADILPIPLLEKAPSHTLDDFFSINPAKAVPFLLDENFSLNQSLAILEYLEEKFPQPPLLPKEIEKRAYIRSLAMDVVCDIHPLNNLRVLRYLIKTMQLSHEKKDLWVKHWLQTGLQTIETKLAMNHHPQDQFILNADPSLFEVCLIPQVRNALASEIDISAFPIIQSIYDKAMQLKAFQLASWEEQPDYGS